LFILTKLAHPFGFRFPTIANLHAQKDCGLVENYSILLALKRFLQIQSHAYFKYLWYIVSASLILPSAWAQTIPATLSWTSETQGIIFSSPVIDEKGIVYVGSNDNNLTAFNTDGSIKWTFTTGNWVDSSPALSKDGSTVYVGSWDNYLYAVNTDDGSLNWSFETSSYITSSPAVDLNDRVYFGSMDSIFYALESNGSLIWEYFVGQPVFSSPAIGDNGTLYFGDENGTLHAINSDGTVKWTYEIEDVVDTNKSILSSPALDTSGNIYFGSGNGFCYSLSDDGDSASLNWKYETGDRVDSSPVLGINDEVFFVSRDGYMRSLPTFSATSENLPNWEVFVGDVFYSTPVVDENGRVYVIGYTGGGENHLFAYDANGAKAWDSNVSSPPFEIPSVVDSSPLLSDDGNLYFGCFDKKLYCLDIGVGPANSDWPMFGRTSKRDSDWPSFNLSISANSGGTVSGGGTYYKESSADINATPDTGYSFAGWNGDGVANPDSSSTIVSMTQDRSVAATFSINSYDLSLSAGEGGSVTGGGSYTYDSDADINATPNTGYSFAGWDGDGVASSGSSSTTVSMTQSRSVAATFTINSYDLTLSAGDGGSVSGGGSFTYGSAADINATPNTGYSFAGWNGDGVNDSTTANTFVSITQNQSVSASFSINSYDLTLSAGDGGSVTGGGSYTYGSDATITATPDTGYSFAGWLGEGMEDSNSLSTSVSMTQDRILTASFTPREIDRYLLVISSLPSSAGVTSGAEEYEDESNVSITATAATGYSFTGWTGDGITNPNLASTSVFMDQDRNITANFATNFYDLNLSAGEGGTVSDGGRFPYNSTADISATPDMGYSFAGWNGSGVATPNSSSTTVSMIQDRYISASFSINSYILNLSSGTGGSVSGAGTYTYGSIINISATPKTGYSFTGWTGSGISDFGSTSTSVSITQDRNISATFSINSYLLSLSSGDGGSVSGSGSFLYGTSADINATPNTGYSFAGWSGNGVATPNSISTTVSMTQNRSISAAFSLNSYTLALSAGTGGTVSNGGSYSYGASVTITATPSTGYSFAGWSGDGVASPSSATSSVSITQDRNLTAYFTKDLHTLSISTPEGGTVNDSGTHEFGSNVGLVAEADTGYAFSHWEGSLVATPNSASTSILLTKNSSVKAIFERLPGFWNQSWMGWVLQNDKNWLYHYPLGWMYSSSAKTSNNYWLWHPELQWVWLEREAFPKSQVWMNTKQRWIFLKIENANNFRYYDYIEKRWISF